MWGRRESHRYPFRGGIQYLSMISLLKDKQTMEKQTSGRKQLKVEKTLPPPREQQLDENVYEYLH